MSARPFSTWRGDVPLLVLFGFESGGRGHTRARERERERERGREREGEGLLGVWGEVFVHIIAVRS